MSAKDKLIAATQTVMAAKGYTSATVDEICATAGVSKGSFYHFFASKEEMTLAALRAYYERGSAELFGPIQGVRDPVRRLRRFLDTTEEKAMLLWSNGCLLGGLATEIAQTQPRLREEISGMFAHLAENLLPLFAPVAQRGGPAAPALAEHYLSAIEGSIVLARMHQDPERILTAIRTFRASIEGWLERAPAA